MAQTDVLVNFVVDRSSSMAGVVPQTIEGFNKFLAEQKAEEGKAWMSLTLFSTEFEVRYVAVDVNEIPEMSTNGENPYFTNGMTALYDAVGITIRGAEKWLENNPYFTGKVVNVVLTDGGENSSQEWVLPAINDLIAQKQQSGWEFVFLGSGQAAWTEGQRFAPTATHYHAAASGQAVSDSYGTMSSSLRSARTTGASFAGNVAQASATLDSAGEQTLSQDEIAAKLGVSSPQVESKSVQRRKDAMKEKK